MTTKRKWILAVGAVVLIGLGYGGYRGYSFLQEAKYWEAKMGHGAGKLKPGDVAPDFELKYKQSDETVRLSSFRGEKPVALIFGSYT